jgi:hypothetical protein
LIDHANTALELVLQASIVVKGVAKNHLDIAAKELKESIELANLGHIGSATLHTEAAVKTILAIFFISLSLGMFRFNRNMQNPIFQFHIHEHLDSPWFCVA